MVLTPQGRVSRYSFDIHYVPRNLRLWLVEASANQIGSPIDQVFLLSVSHYDESLGKYTPAIMNIVRAGRHPDRAGHHCPREHATLASEARPALDGEPSAAGPVPEPHDGGVN